MNLDDPQDRSVAAGEYVLGTLDSEARAALERRLTGDAALQGEVYAWQDRLVGLIRGVAPADPGPQVWSRIEAALTPTGGSAGDIAGVRAQSAPAIAAGDAAQRGNDGGTTAHDKSASTTADGTAASGGATGTAARGAANDPLWQRLRRWQITGGLAIAAVLVLASLLVLRPPAPAEGGERYLAVLQAPDSKTTGWIVEATAGGSVRLVPVGATAEVPPGKVLQFWTKGEREAGPTSLGLIEPGQVTELPADKLPVLEPRQLFELTLEPEGGSPLGRPTGPILFVGSTVRI
ncbi:MAG: anti-sigma factor [Methylibium sp.]|nr:anti-sigma factor [Methylibium sp.]